jgi:hypothetical protein
MLVTVDRYRAITGDQTTAASAVSALIEEATEELAEVLDRPLEHGTRTERLIATRDGRLWPRAIPITAATGWTIDGLALLGAQALDWPGGNDAWPFTEAAGVDVEYSGGWTEATVPKCIERDIAAAAKILGTPNAGGIVVPAGANRVQVGDVSVAWKDGAPSGGALSTALSGVWSRRTLSYRYRVERGVGCR